MIEHEAEVHSPDDLAVARNTFVDWMQAIGYRPVSAPFLSSIQFERGSAASTWTSMDPAGYASVVSATFKAVESGGTDVKLTWAVSTVGQLMTKLDMDYWRKEIASTTDVARGERGSPEILAAHRAKILKVYGLGIVGFLVAVFVAVLAGYAVMAIVLVLVSLLILRVMRADKTI